MIVYLFPGQGSQDVGMGRDLAGGEGRIEALVGVGSEVAGTDLWGLMQRGPERELLRASRLQPALTAVSLAYLRLLEGGGVRAGAVAGHSSGEMAALAAAGVVTDEEAVAMAGVRGRMMEQAAGEYPGGMTAVMGRDVAGVRELLAEIGEPGVVVANDNAGDQVVLSGPTDGLARVEGALAAHRLRCRRLRVSGPWHSPAMAAAREQFTAWVAGRVFREAAVPVMSNATGREERDGERLKDLIARQLTEPVRWRETMEGFRDAGGSGYVEIGPGRVLAGLVRLNGQRDVPVWHAGSVRGVEQAVKEIAGTWR